MTNRPLRALALLVVALALVAAGCGSKKKGAYSGSKADFAAAMNSICVTVNAKIKAVGSIGSLADLGTKGPQLLAIGKDGIDKIKKLGTPPDEIKTAVEDFITSSDKSADLIQQLIDAAKAKDAAKATKIESQLTPLNTKTDKDAAEIGAPACGSNA